MLELSYADSPPKLIAGAPGVDFLNTVEWRGNPSRLAERLTNYVELVIWCSAAGLLTKVESRQLIAEAQRHVSAARRIWQTAIELREAVVAVLNSSGGRAAVDRLNRSLGASRFEHRVECVAEGGLRATTVPIGDALRLPLDRIAQNVVAVLTADGLERIRSCTNERCGWFFIDASRNHARRWCQMTTCGNQAKARAHYARHRTAKDHGGGA